MSTTHEFDEGVGTKTEKHTTTLVCNTQTSNKKNTYLREKIDTAQDVIQAVTPRLVTFQRSRIGGSIDHPSLLNVARQMEIPTTELYAKIQYEMCSKAESTMAGWLERGGRQNSDSRPELTGDYIRVRSQHVKIEKNNGKYGVGVKFCKEHDSPVPDDANYVWWGLQTGEYHEEILDDLITGDLDLGNGTELHLTDDGAVRLHLSVNHSVETVKKNEAECVIGVDVGQRNFYHAVAVDGDTPIDNQTGKSSYGEFVDARNRVRKQKQVAQHNGNIEKYEKWDQTERDVTSKYLHEIANEIVDFATDHHPAKIHLENLTGLRDNQSQHDWPYKTLQTYIAYKARLRGVPVYQVTAYGTSKRCPECGFVDSVNDMRSENTYRFLCHDCGYENADPDWVGGYNIACNQPTPESTPNEF